MSGRAGCELVRDRRRRCRRAARPGPRRTVAERERARRAAARGVAQRPELRDRRTRARDPGAPADPIGGRARYGPGPARLAWRGSHARGRDAGGTVRGRASGMRLRHEQLRTSSIVLHYRHGSPRSRGRETAAPGTSSIDLAEPRSILPTAPLRTRAPRRRFRRAGPSGGRARPPPPVASRTETWSMIARHVLLSLALLIRPAHRARPRPRRRRRPRGLRARLAGESAARARRGAARPAHHRDPAHGDRRSRAGGRPGAERATSSPSRAPTTRPASSSSRSDDSSAPRSWPERRGGPLRPGTGGRRDCSSTGKRRSLDRAAEHYAEAGRLTRARRCVAPAAALQIRAR